jgi:uncharacterized damage-inducible protein DinB
MSIAQAFLAEFEVQAPVTRRFLERLPEDKLGWKPHNNPAQAPESFHFPQPASRQEILKTLEESIATVRSLLPKFDDAAMKESWRMVSGGGDLFAQPRGEFLRDVMLSHWYQHRGQFSVYLRMLDVAVPASWGPSADEPPAFVQKARSA